MRLTLVFSAIVAICGSITHALPTVQGWEFLLFYTAWQAELFSGAVPRTFAAQPHGSSTTFGQFLLQIAKEGDRVTLGDLIKSSHLFDTTAPAAEPIVALLAQAKKRLMDGSTRSFQIGTNIQRLLVHPPNTRDKQYWAQTLGNTTDSLVNTVKHDKRYVEALRDCLKYFTNIRDIRVCDNSQYQIDRLNDAEHNLHLGHRYRVVTKQGPLPGCRIIDYAATWRASPAITYEDRVRIVGYMKQQSQGRDARIHMAAISAAEEGVMALNKMIDIITKECATRQAQCSVM